MWVGGGGGGERRQEDGNKCEQMQEWRPRVREVRGRARGKVQNRIGRRTRVISRDE